MLDYLEHIEKVKGYRLVLVVESHLSELQVDATTFRLSFHSRLLALFG